MRLHISGAGAVFEPLARSEKKRASLVSGTLAGKGKWVKKATQDTDFSGSLATRRGCRDDPAAESATIRAAAKTS
ncbi:MAG TPA: hypothetical protein VGO25_03790, partial [Rhodanobacteraceae bacterium]|nr:hypothetical protein [Rhodanobacteraceae bacterium]